jgi:uncharacterized protein (TIGR03435 family)
MMKRFVSAVMAMVLAGAGVAAGQGLAGTFPVPAFEVASVRPVAVMDQQALIAVLQTGRRPEEMKIDIDRATFKYMSLKQLVAYGYKVRAFQVSGPDWMTTDRFDITAKLPEGGSKDDVPAMVKALLDERFKLAAHLETKDHSVLGLMVAKSGSKLTEVAVPAALTESAELEPGQTKVDSMDGPMILTHNKNGSTTYNMGARGTMTLRVDGQAGTMDLEGSAMTMKGLALMLTTLGGTSAPQVVDMTGLKGNYEVRVVFALSELMAGLRDSGIDLPTRGGPGANDPSGDSTLSDAMGKLGLKLTGTHAPVEQLVVDHVEKLPTDN